MIALVIFGPGKLPELGSALGKGIRELKRSMGEASDEPGVPVAGTLPPPSAPRAAAPTSASYTCARCSAPASPDARYCTRCGQPLTAA